MGCHLFFTEMCVFTNDGKIKNVFQGEETGFMKQVEGAKEMSMH